MYSIRTGLACVAAADDRQEGFCVSFAQIRCRKRHLSSVAAVKMYDNRLIMCNIEIPDGWKETSVSIYVPDDSDKLPARANDGRESEVNIKPNLVRKKSVSDATWVRGKWSFFRWRCLWFVTCDYFPHFPRLQAEVIWLASHISAALTLLQQERRKRLHFDHHMW